jgi:hypothetical protein
VAVEDRLGEAECRGTVGGFLSRERSAVLASSRRVVVSSCWLLVEFSAAASSQSQSQTEGGPTAARGAGGLGGTNKCQLRENRLGRKKTWLYRAGAPSQDKRTKPISAIAKKRTLPPDSTQAVHIMHPHITWPMTSTQQILHNITYQRKK